MQSWAVLIGLAIGAQPIAQLDTKESPAELAAWIDAKLAANWRAKNLPVREVASDEVFLRRAYLELTGSIPSVAEARDFLESTSASKREQLIRTLLDDKRYAEHTARQWARALAPAGNTRGPLEVWLRGEFRKNTPFDQMTRSMLGGPDAANSPKNPDSGAGSNGFAAAVGGTPERFAEAVGRGLLGVRLGCAQCHNHPFALWTQDDFWGLAAFFAPTGKRVTATDGGKEYAAKFLDGSAPNFDAGKAPRVVLADWLATGENRYFTTNVVNRVWQDLCGTGLVSTIDDLDTLSAEERKEILDELAAKFAANGFNVRWLVEGICLSKAYQRASAATGNGSARRPVRTLTPDQVFAALDQSLGLKKGRGFSPRYTAEGVTLMAQLEAARGATPTDFKGGIPQALLLMNGALVTQATALDESMTLRAVVDAPFLKDAEKLDTLFLAAYSRLPRPAERERLMKVIRASADADARKQAYANIFWALLNSPEFVLCP